MSQNYSNILRYKSTISIVILVIFHAVGIGGMGFGLNPEMVKLSWMNLVLTGVLVLGNHTPFNRSFVIHALAVFSLGIAVEVLGVNTGFPFGNYTYGESLGWQIGGAPWVIGLNWWLLVYCSAQIISVITQHKAARVLLTPTLMVLMDMLIEPLCGRLDFWHWENNTIPIANYVSWYLIALAFVFAYFQWTPPQKTNKVGIAAFIIQALFFISLTILL